MQLCVGGMLSRRSVTPHVPFGICMLGGIIYMKAESSQFD